MRGVLVRCCGRVVVVDLNEDNVRGIGAIAEDVESYDARLVATGSGVLVSRGQEGVTVLLAPLLRRHERSAGYSTRADPITRHPHVHSRRLLRCGAISSAASAPYASSKRAKKVSPKRYSWVPTTSIA